MSPIRPLTLEPILKLGYLLRDLQECKEGDMLHSDKEPLGIIQRVETLHRLLPSLGLRDAEYVARYSLRPSVTDLKRLNDKGNVALKASHAQQLKKSIERLEAAVLSEATQKLTFPIRSSSRYLIELFIETPEEQFDLTFALDPELPEAVQRNLSEAGRCLAVGFAPAAILFTCLATEVVFRYYYEQITGTKPLDSKGRFKGWGTLNRELRDKNLCPATITDVLGEIVSKYRNSAMHTGIDYKDGMELEVWELCRDAVQQMIDDLEMKGKVTRFEL